MLGFGLAGNNSKWGEYRYDVIPARSLATSIMRNDTGVIPLYYRGPC